MNNGMCLREAAEYYAKPCESNKRIPQDIQKALRYYERAAISPDYLDFNDHAYATMQAIILRTLNIDGQSQDWSPTYYNNQLFTRSMLFGRISLMYLLSKKVIPLL